MPAGADTPNLCVVTTTVGSAQDARRLAQAAVHARLAACVQVEAITSHFRWEGAVQEDAEWRLTCKTAPRAAEALLALLDEQHPYALPEMVVQRLQASPAYGQWVDGEVAP